MNSTTNNEGRNDGGLLTPSQLARHLGCSRRTVQRLTTTQVIPVIRIGTLTRYDVNKVIAALAAREVHDA